MTSLDQFPRTYKACLEILADNGIPATHADISYLDSDLPTLETTEAFLQTLTEEELTDFAIGEISTQIELRENHPSAYVAWNFLEEFFNAQCDRTNGFWH